MQIPDDVVAMLMLLAVCDLEGYGTLAFAHHQPSYVVIGILESFEFRRKIIKEYYWSSFYVVWLMNLPMAGNIQSRKLLSGIVQTD